MPGSEQGAGHPSTAAPLAAEGWPLLRDDYPHDAERLHGAMHFQSRLEQALEAEQRQAQMEAGRHNASDISPPKAFYFH